MKGFEFAVKNGLNWGLFALVLVGFTAVVVWYLFFYRKSESVKPLKFDYLTVDGNDRKAVIAACVSAEKHLAKNGFRRRMENESYREYAFAAQLYAGDDAVSLNWLADMASRAAFSSTGISAEQTISALDHAKDLRTKIS